jgi:glutamate N-acetyltransferase/amino-acid N-acetyltransferase
MKLDAVKTVEGGVCAPMGFRASAVCAQIKNLKSTKLDCALIVSDVTATAAGCFTTNQVKAAPVQWSQGVCIRGAARAVFINSGNANACTGAQGLEDTQRTAELVALGLDVPITEVAIMSTGVIGALLPMDRIEKGVAGCIPLLSVGGGHDAALAIMTTDTVHKELAIEVPLSGGTVRIGAICKGAGMICPDMATMLCTVTTDAKIADDALAPLLREATEKSFNRVCIDNDMSTNDTVLCLANGMAGGAPLQPGTEDYDTFAAALTHVCQQMAHKLVKDGEGVTKFVEIDVAGTVNDADAKKIAKSIAQSMLVKTAFHGEDPNWGRIACAAGYAGVNFEQYNLCVWLDDVMVVEDGLPTGYEEADAAAVMKRPEYTVRVRVGDGPGACIYWTSDLSREYVSINADYRS